MDEKEYERIVREIQAASTDELSALPVLTADNVRMNASFATKEEAINACADILIDRGYAFPDYRSDMLERDRSTSVYLGNGVALPHGLDSSKSRIKSSGICFIQVPDGVDFDGNTAYLLIGVAGSEDTHLKLLGRIAEILCNEENIHRLRVAKNAAEVLEILSLDGLENV
ncbi:PTS sugar transporter subunit IIA [uncultured Selenomonas sp.]|uniref:PTS sugar transporter subunit IIA n=1 Tax=uncultured Selenomonas sp. TaxID=159275 RepID=UPI0028EAF4A8|nr:PTS sugar transporter subunit IIA [uncultured Selenomonas sp.]